MRKGRGRRERKEKERERESEREREKEKESNRQKEREREREKGEKLENFDKFTVHRISEFRPPFFESFHFPVGKVFSAIFYEFGESFHFHHN